MKTIIAGEQELVAGLVAKGELGVEGAKLKVNLSAEYPLAMVIEPVMSTVDKALDGLEALIPGDWDKAIIEGLKLDIRAKVVALLAE